jgi:hypothetical protein
LDASSTIFLTGMAQAENVTPSTKLNLHPSQTIHTCNPNVEENVPDFPSSGKYNHKSLLKVKTIPLISNTISLTHKIIFSLIPIPIYQANQVQSLTNTPVINSRNPSNNHLPNPMVNTVPSQSITITNNVSTCLEEEAPA